MNKTTISISLVALCSVFAGAANAGCASSGNATQALLLPLPGVFEDGALEPRASSSDASKEDSEGTLVGLWDVKFLVGGKPFDEGFDQFHSDGTEILNDTTNPVAGNVCLGVWTKTGGRSYKLHHLYWNFDSQGNAIGRGSWDSLITLSASGNSYTGTFTMKNFDLNGKPAPANDVAGTLQAQRITVQ